MSEGTRKSSRRLLLVGFCTGVGAVVIFLLFVLNFDPTAGLNIDTYLEFLAALIGSIAVLGTFGFLYFAFNIWNVQEKLNQEQDEIKKLRARAEEIVKETEMRYSSYSEVYDSLALYNYIIQYIGSPLWEESDDPNKLPDGAEPEAEKIDRQVSMTRILMSMLAMETDGDIRATLAQCRDVVGHLRANDAILFYDFLEKRLQAIRPVNSDDIDTLTQIELQFRKKKLNAERARLTQNLL